jgi:hypothetical protein
MLLLVALKSDICLGTTNNNTQPSQTKMRRVSQLLPRTYFNQLRNGMETTPWSLVNPSTEQPESHSQSVDDYGQWMDQTGLFETCQSGTEFVFVGVHNDNGGCGGHR